MLFKLYQQFYFIIGRFNKCPENFTSILLRTMQKKTQQKYGYIKCLKFSQDAFTEEIINLFLHYGGINTDGKVMTNVTKLNMETCILQDLIFMAQGLIVNFQNSASIFFISYVMMIIFSKKNQSQRKNKTFKSFQVDQCLSQLQVTFKIKIQQILDLQKITWLYIGQTLIQQNIKKQMQIDNITQSKQTQKTLKELNYNVKSLGFFQFYDLQKAFSNIVFNRTAYNEVQAQVNGFQNLQQKDQTNSCTR